MNVDPDGHWSWGTFWKGVGMVVVGVVAVVVSVATFGAATPAAITAVAAITATAGTLTTVNGAATIVEAATDYNIVRDGAFQGNEAAYNAYANVTKSIASIGSAVLGVYNMTGYGQAARAGRKFLGNGYTKASNTRWISKDGLRQMIVDKTHHILDGEVTSNHFNLITNVTDVRMGRSAIAQKLHLFYKGFKIWIK